MAKVMCLILPRADGTVNYDILSGVGKAAKLKRYTFEADGAGNLVAEVSEKAHLDAMLKYPERFRRIQTAAEMKEEAKAKEKAEADRKKREAEEIARREAEEAAAKGQS